MAHPISTYTTRNPEQAGNPKLVLSGFLFIFKINIKPKSTSFGFDMFRKHTPDRKMCSAICVQSFYDSLDFAIRMNEPGIEPGI